MRPTASAASLPDNYTYGIRRFPYSTDNTVNPLTWADVDDVTANYAGGIAISPLGFEQAGAFEVHNVGEIWALTLWEVRSRVIADPAGANGSVPAGNQTMLQLVTDALKLTPSDPSFIDAREALLDADCATNACANERWIWEGFADRGLGYGAVAPLGVAGFSDFAGHMSIEASSEMPELDVSGITVDDTIGNNNGAIDPGEPVRLTVQLRNPWRGTLVRRPQRHGDAHEHHAGDHDPRRLVRLSRRSRPAAPRRATRSSSGGSRPRVRSVDRPDLPGHERARHDVDERHQARRAGVRARPLP